MPVLEFAQETMPTAEEFSRKLEQAQETASPLDDLLALGRRLHAFEQQYGMSSAEFYERYNRGEMGDDIDFIRWSGRYRLYCELKEDIEQSLAGIQPAAAPDLSEVLREIDDLLYPDREER